MGSSWNPWYPSWYLVLVTTTPNTPPTRKSPSYRMYIIGIDLDVHVRVFNKAIHANGEKNDSNIVNLYYFKMGIKLCAIPLKTLH
jgi:hypothetical protein